VVRTSRALTSVCARSHHSRCRSAWRASRCHPGTLRLVNVATGIVVPLISAAIAGLVAWIVTRRTAQTARENWLLDERHGVYEKAVETVMDLLGEAGSPALAMREALSDPAKRRALLISLRRIFLIAPQNVRMAARRAIDTAGPGSGTYDHQRTVDALNALIVVMRDDLVPERMR
jgi:hypothetical protein